MSDSKALVGRFQAKCERTKQCVVYTVKNDWPTLSGLMQDFVNGSLILSSLGSRMMGNFARSPLSLQGRPVRSSPSATRNGGHSNPPATPSTEVFAVDLSLHAPRPVDQRGSACSIGSKFPQIDSAAYLPRFTLSLRNGNVSPTATPAAIDAPSTSSSTKLNLVDEERAVDDKKDKIASVNEEDGYGSHDLKIHRTRSPNQVRARFEENPNVHYEAIANDTDERLLNRCGDKTPPLGGNQDVEQMVYYFSSSTSPPLSPHNGTIALTETFSTESTSDGLRPTVDRMHAATMPPDWQKGGNNALLGPPNQQRHSPEYNIPLTARIMHHADSNNRIITQDHENQSEREQAKSTREPRTRRTKAERARKTRVMYAGEFVGTNHAGEPVTSAGDFQRVLTQQIAAEDRPDGPCHGAKEVLHSDGSIPPSAAALAFRRSSRNASDSEQSVSADNDSSIAPFIRDGYYQPLAALERNSNRLADAPDVSRSLLSRSKDRSSTLTEEDFPDVVNLRGAGYRYPIPSESRTGAVSDRRNREGQTVRIQTAALDPRFTPISRENLSPISPLSPSGTVIDRETRNEKDAQPETAIRDQKLNFVLREDLPEILRIRRPDNLDRASHPTSRAIGSVGNSGEHAGNARALSSAPETCSNLLGFEDPSMSPVSTSISSQNLQYVAYSYQVARKRQNHKSLQDRQRACEAIGRSPAVRENWLSYNLQEKSRSLAKFYHSQSTQAGKKSMLPQGARSLPPQLPPLQESFLEISIPLESPRSYRRASVTIRRHDPSGSATFDGRYHTYRSQQRQYFQQRDHVARRNSKLMRRWDESSRQIVQRRSTFRVNF
ncbi:hypothetical protein MMC28_006784 [Mycoblastus sanguinarius]|nr:hypothetical protein [Mycoblastus sanguinarius]